MFIIGMMIIKGQADKMASLARFMELNGAILKGTTSL